MEILSKNPHPAYHSYTGTISDGCEMGNCVERFIPKNMRGTPLFDKIGELMCRYENTWSDLDLKMYLQTIDDFYRTGTGGFKVLNWYSLMSWLEASEFNWTDNFAGGNGVGEEDFYSKYSLSTKDIWLSFSAANDNAFDEEGFNYYTWFLEPYVGTNLIQRKLLEKLDGIDGEVIDWYDNYNIINAYSFQFKEFPGWEKTKILIIGSKLLKNAESILISIKDANCPNRFILSHSFLDTDYLSDITALRFEGVDICFQRFVDGVVPQYADLFRIQKFYTKWHTEIIDYYHIKKLSVDFEMDDLVENKIYGTHTPDRPGRFVQMLPAWMPQGSNTWEAGVTWEDHYDWRSVTVTNLVRNFLDKEREPLFWTDADVWGRWIGWTGDPEEWVYNKPPSSQAEYYEDRNFITGFGPTSGRSLYEPIIFSRRQRIYDESASVFSGKKRIINYWLTEDELSKSLILDDTRVKVIYSEKTREDTSNHYYNVVTIWGNVPYTVGASVPYELTVFDFNLSEHKNDTLVHYWDVLRYSDNLILDDKPTRIAYSLYSKNEAVLNSTMVKFWDEYKLSNNIILDDTVIKTVYGNRMREDTSVYNQSQVSLWGDVPYSESVSEPYMVSSFDLTESTHSKVIQYWRELSYSDTLVLDGFGNRVVYSEALRDIPPVTSENVSFWEDRRLSRNQNLDEPTFKVIYSKKVRE